MGTALFKNDRHRPDDDRLDLSMALGTVLAITMAIIRQSISPVFTVIAPAYV